ncbi:MAG: amino acid ABC transporter permease [Geminicoccaceae bacterium]|nr:MAG: amino acid ABC transporter permease [Geminicoccaceae bacterium]
MFENPTQRRLGWLDVVLICVLLLGVAWIIYRVETRLVYNWNWGMIPGYFWFLDPITGQWRSNMLLQGLLTTIRMTIWASIIALIVGTLMAIARISPLPSVAWLARTYVELVRNLPPLVFIFIFFFFLSTPISNQLGLADWARALEGTQRSIVTFLFGPPNLFANFITGTICLALFEAAYVTEIIRAGIQNVGRGQWEASTALGLNRWRTLRLVILPQAIRRILPPLTGQMISLIKDSSIVSLISVQELTFTGQQISVATRRVFEVWLTVAALYFVLCFSLSIVSRRLEARFRRADR